MLSGQGRIRFTDIAIGGSWFVHRIVSLVVVHAGQPIASGTLAEASIWVGSAAGQRGVVAAPFSMSSAVTAAHRVGGGRCRRSRSRVRDYSPSSGPVRSSVGG